MERKEGRDFSSKKDVATANSMVTRDFKKSVHRIYMALNSHLERKIGNQILYLLFEMTAKHPHKRRYVHFLQRVKST